MFKLSHSQRILLLLLGAMTLSVAANPSEVIQMAPYKEPPSRLYAYVVSFSAGPTWARGGETQTLFLQPDIEKTYTANKPTSSLADGEIFLGVQRALSDNLEGQLGLAVAGATNASLSGDIWDDADPDFDNYLYGYKIYHTHVAIKGKLLKKMSFAKPYVSASLGVGFNHAHDFTNTPLIYQAIPQPDFSSHTTTAFTYTVGVGLQREIAQNWQVGIGYEFADWGKSQLGLAPGQTMGSGLSLNHFYTNGLMLNLTYVS